ncbi:unnamed protein product [Adineta steineri]|uniref:F-box domain-containing protein n=1 Tax=Adineta steineri TaxID=433720 RepID=A0A814VPG4_9BILA|nr:unnamed protein product [Adineta steineri]CAF1190006.1 unnamed protein product [Adineta steineri]
MNQFNIHLLDLPDEILLIILKKLNNVDVLYSLFGINNERFENIIRHDSFSSTLNIVLSAQNSTIFNSILNRLCSDILPQISFNVKCLILQPDYMERLLLTTSYPNLTSLKLLNLEYDYSLRYFIDDSPIGHILKQQITKLDLLYNKSTYLSGSSEVYTKRVYAPILNYCEKLQHLNVTSPLGLTYISLSLRYLPSNTFFSSTLTYLCIIVSTFVDFVYLLDGRLKNLSTLIVQFRLTDTDSSIIHNLDDLPNLKCFSLMYYGTFKEDLNPNEILSHLRRMINLEKLTLHLRFLFKTTFTDPIYLLNQFTIHMPQLTSFNFYLGMKYNKCDLLRYLSNNNIKQNYVNIRDQTILDFVQNVNHEIVYHILTLPVQFTEFAYVGNTLPNITFNYVTDLVLYDEVPFEHEYFLRISKTFPNLTKLNVINLTPWSYDMHISFDNVIQAHEIVEYSHLRSLDITRTSIFYVEQFFNETKTRLPSLTELKVFYEELRIITQDFTRQTTRRNCANVKQLGINGFIADSKDYWSYFPLL